MSTETRRGATTAQRARRPARIGYWVAVIAGAMDLLSAALPAHTRRLRILEHLFPGTVISGAEIFTGAIGIALLLVAGGLRRRSRLAWAIVVILLGVSAVGHILKALDLEEALIEAFLCGLLAGKGEYFTARAYIQGGFLRRLGEVGVVVIVTGLYGLIACSFATDGIGWFALLRQVARMAIGAGTSLPLSDRSNDILAPSIAAIFLFGLLVVIARALAPNRQPSPAPATREEALASNDSLAWFATRDERSTVRARSAVIAYEAHGSVALASGDPLGNQTDWDDVINAFCEDAGEQGRVAAVVACGADAAAAYRRAGLRQIYMGDEAILDLSTFTIEGGSMKTIRGSVNRAKRAGYTVEVRRVSDLDDTLTAKLQVLSEQWREGQEERGYSMSLGRLFAEEDRDAFVAIASDDHGEPRGFVHFVPWARDGASLDAMRRDRQALAVLNDFLIAEAARLFPEYGVHRVSLNFSALRGVLVAGAQPEATWILRLQRAVLLKLSGSFQIETLYRFNKKFDPQWQPRYAMFETVEDAPRVLFAALRAEGLLPRLRNKKLEEATTHEAAVSTSAAS